MIEYVVRVTGNVNSQMTSTERVLTYTRIQAERRQDLPRTPPEHWPHAGGIEFKDVSLWHYTGSLSALKNISFKINSTEKIGIAGEDWCGKIVFGCRADATRRDPRRPLRLNINDLNVLSTRKCISVISQSPTLIKGTIRLNLDPFGEHTDTEICTL